MFTVSHSTDADVSRHVLVVAYVDYDPMFKPFNIIR